MELREQSDEKSLVTRGWREDAQRIFDVVMEELQQHGARIPGPTYRVQLNRNLTFHQLEQLVEYLHALGMGEVYSSPFFKAPPESMHGYDVVDHNAINPVIGTREELHSLTARLSAFGMGLLL